MISNVKKVAILCRRSGASVTLYESESRCGGHTLTDDSPGYPVDLGFQVAFLYTTATTFHHPPAAPNSSRLAEFCWPESRSPVLLQACINRAHAQHGPVNIT